MSNRCSGENVLDVWFFSCCKVLVWYFVLLRWNEELLYGVNSVIMVVLGFVLNNV